MVLTGMVEEGCCAVVCWSRFLCCCNTILIGVLLLYIPNNKCTIARPTNPTNTIVHTLWTNALGQMCQMLRRGHDSHRHSVQQHLRALPMPIANHTIISSLQQFLLHTMMLLGDQLIPLSYTLASGVFFSLTFL